MNVKKIVGAVFVILCFLAGFLLFRETREPLKPIKPMPSYEDLENTKIDSIPDINIGIIPFDTVINYKLQVKNIGEHDLFIKHASTNCGCVRVKSSSKPTPPDSVTWIDIRIKPTDLGRLVKTVTVYGNIAPNPIRFKVIGMIEEKK